MNFLPRLIGLYDVESSNYIFYKAKGSSYHLKRSDVWFKVILGVTTVFLSSISLFCAINMSLLLGALTFLLGCSFSWLLFLLKLLVTGELDDDYSRNKEYFQEEIDYKISAEICKAKSKICMIALSNLNRIFRNEGCDAFAALNKGKLKYGRDKLIDPVIDDFKSAYSGYSFKSLSKEQKFIMGRLKMLYKELEIDVCRKVMRKELKIRLNASKSNSCGFRPENLDNDEVFRNLLFYLSNKYGVSVYSLENHYPLDSLQASSRLDYKILEIAILEIRGVLVERLLAEKFGGDSLASDRSCSIAPIQCNARKGITEKLMPESIEAPLNFSRQKALRI